MELVSQSSSEAGRQAGSLCYSLCDYLNCVRFLGVWCRCTSNV